MAAFCSRSRSAAIRGAVVMSPRSNSALSESSPRSIVGELTPKTQADVERAMLDWVNERGETVAESTVRPMARKLFAEWEREGKN